MIEALLIILILSIIWHSFPALEKIIINRQIHKAASEIVRGAWTWVGAHIITKDGNKPSTITAIHVSGSTSFNIKYDADAYPAALQAVERCWPGFKQKGK